MRAILGFVLIVSVLASSVVHADPETCRLIIHVNYKDGKKKVRFEDAEANSHTSCKLAAKEREYQQMEGDEVQGVKVIFKYLGTPDLGPVEASW